MEASRDQAVLTKWQEALNFYDVQKVTDIIHTLELHKILINPQLGYLTNPQASQNDIIEILTQMGLAGFNLRQVLSDLNGGDSIGELLESIVLSGRVDLYRHLWHHEDYLNMYSVEDFKRVTHAILSNDKLAE